MHLARHLRVAGPDVFEVNDEGDLVLLRADITDDELQGVEKAVAGCPTEALRLVRD